MYESNNTGYYLVLLSIFVWIVYHEHKNAKKTYKSIFKEFGFAFLIIFFIRSFVIDIFQIPSGSMVNNLLVGDIPTVMKWPYGYNQFSLWLSEHYAFDTDCGKLFERDPDRGDVVVFRLPSRPEINFVKRVIGLPGDKVQVINGIVHVNGIHAVINYDKEYLYENDNQDGVSFNMIQYKEKLPNTDKEHIIIKLKGEHPDAVYANHLKARNNTTIFYVPKDHFFMMGDNRDFSNDSRSMSEVGFIHRKFIIGKVGFVLFSMANKVRIYEPHRWFFNLRYARFFKWIY